jgi:hypothetical protein
MRKNSIKNKTLLLILPLLILLLSQSCKKEETDTTAPGPVSVLNIEALNGGALITYTLPKDMDLLYVKAEYTNSLGNKVFKASSRFTNSIEIDGFNDTLTHQVKLYTIDQSNNQSDPIEISVKPLKSFIYLVQESIKIEPDLGGIKINWENPMEKTVFVYLYYADSSKEQERILSSSKQNESFVVRGMDSIAYDFSVRVEDFNGNKTEKQFIERVKPLFEEKIDKSTWKLVSQLSVNGNAWEGLTVNFWDDVIDTKESPADNSYFIINRDNNGGILNYPLDIVVDLNKNIILNRLVVWQRAYWYINGNNGVSTDYYYYQNENMRSFDLYASNDKQEWLKLGSFDIGDPKDGDGNIPASKIQEAIDGHQFELDNTSDPFRYLKISITSNYGSETNVYGSEITLYGLDNVNK